MENEESRNNDDPKLKERMDREAKDFATNLQNLLQTQNKLEQSINRQGSTQDSNSLLNKGEGLVLNLLAFIPFIGQFIFGFKKVFGTNITFLVFVVAPCACIFFLFIYFQQALSANPGQLITIETISNLDCVETAFKAVNNQQLEVGQTTNCLTNYTRESLERRGILPQN
jgi:hypothetical protein